MFNIDYHSTDQDGQNWRGHHHGRRGNRGFRQYGEEHRGQGHDEGERFQHRGGRGHRSSRPPGLRGKEIGLYYARKGKQKRMQEELLQVYFTFGHRIKHLPCSFRVTQHLGEIIILTF